MRLQCQKMGRYWTTSLIIVEFRGLQGWTKAKAEGDLLQLMMSRIKDHQATSVITAQYMGLQGWTTTKARNKRLLANQCDYY